MEALKAQKKEAFAAIAYHTDDSFVDPANSFNTRYAYYQPLPWSIPHSVIDGSWEFHGGYTDAYDRFLAAYNQAAALTPPVEISLSLEIPGKVRTIVTNTSSTPVQGTLHIVLVERFRPYAWRDMNVLDFICRTMMPDPNGQQMTIAPSKNIVSDQAFSVQSDWNYCSIIAFFQTADKRIVQGSIINIEDTFPTITLQEGPATGDLLHKGSTQTISYTTSRPLPSVTLEISVDGGATWSAGIQATETGPNTYSWTVSDVNHSRCLLRIRDSYGEAQAVSGLFAMGIPGDFNFDNSVNASDRGILIDHLTDNRGTLLAGSDLNSDGMVDLFDLIYFDANYGQ